MKFNLSILQNMLEENDNNYLKTTLQYIENFDIDVDDFRVEYLPISWRQMLEAEAKINKSIKFQKTSSINRLK